MRIHASVVFSVASAVVGCGGSSAGGAEEPAAPEGPSIMVTEELGHPHIGDQAPDFEVSTPEGESLRLANLRGKVVALSFVTSWCPFSQAEQPHLARLARDFADDENVEVVIVNIDQTEEGYRSYVERVPMNAPVYYSASAEAVRSYVPPRAVPNITRDRWRVLVTANLVIDREGIIRFFTVTDTLHFDAEMRYVREKITEMAAER